jgi:ABC-2 type transport system ATP-binding protein
MDPAGRVEVLELSRDLAHRKGMSLLFSSHLLPDVEYVCDHIMVLGGGSLLAHGRMEDLKRRVGRQYEVRVKNDTERFAAQLTKAGLGVQAKDEVLLVEFPNGDDASLLWQTAAASGEQIRLLRPRQSSLEEVFLEAISGARG